MISAYGPKTNEASSRMLQLVFFLGGGVKYEMIRRKQYLFETKCFVFLLLEHSTVNIQIYKKFAVALTFRDNCYLMSIYFGSMENMCISFSFTNADVRLNEWFWPDRQTVCRGRFWIVLTSQQPMTYSPIGRVTLNDHDTKSLFMSGVLAGPTSSYAWFPDNDQQ